MKSLRNLGLLKRFERPALHVSKLYVAQGLPLQHNTVHADVKKEKPCSTGQRHKTSQSTHTHSEETHNHNY